LYSAVLVIAYIAGFRSSDRIKNCQILKIYFITYKVSSLFLYLGAVAIIFGVGFGNSNSSQVLTIIPFLGLGVAFILN